MDKLTKGILKFLNSKPNASSLHCNFDSDLQRIAKELGTDKEAIRSCVRWMEEHGFIKFIKDSSGRNAMFYLDHKGLHWKEFRRREIIRYLEDKWIDCLAMLLSLAALILSIMNMYGGSPTGN